MLLATLLSGCAAEITRATGHASTTTDALNATYTIAGRRVTLVGARSEVDIATGSAARLVTRYFGEEVHADLDGDGRQDVVFILTQQTSSTGTFFYVAAALNKVGGVVGSHGVLLGDRVAPQSLAAGPDNVIVVNYAQRRAGESFATPPSQATTRHLRFDPASSTFGEIAYIEGEADPGRMTLTMKPWTWNRVTRNGQTETPLRAGAFSLEFGGDGVLTVATDCNRGSASYIAKDGAIEVSDVASTRMFCEGSMEPRFLELLAGVSRYEFTSRGQLILQWPDQDISLTFR